MYSKTEQVLAVRVTVADEDLLSIRHLCGAAYFGLRRLYPTTHPHKVVDRMRVS